MNNIQDSYTLNNGLNIPCLGFGTYKAAEGNMDILKTAISAGYRYFDTASFYGTEEYLGQAVKESNIARDEFFIVSKVWKTEMGYKNTKTAFYNSLKRLQLDYLDLYLIHWPKPEPDTKEWKELDLDTWRALEELYQEGKIKGIGLSNFLPHHMEHILKYGKIKPVVNQLEFHPGYTQESAVNYCKQHDVRVQGWSPIGRKKLLDNSLIRELATTYGVSGAQICLRYGLQKGIILLPKASSLDRMKQNQDIFSFAISQEDIYRLDTMPQTCWSGEHPDMERVMF